MAKQKLEFTKAGAGFISVAAPAPAPASFRLADKHETFEFEHEHEFKYANKFEEAKTGDLRENIVARQSKGSKADSSATSSTSPAPGASRFRSQASSESRPVKARTSFAEHLKTMKLRQSMAEDSGADTFENVWAGTKRTQCAGGVSTLESVIEDSYVEVDTRESHIKALEASSATATGSHVRYLGLALQDAIGTRLPKSTKEGSVRDIRDMSFSSRIASIQKTQSTSNPTITPSAQGSVRTEESSSLPTGSSSNNRSAPVIAPACSTLKHCGRIPEIKSSTPVDNATGSNGSSPISTKNYKKIPTINTSLFKFGGNSGRAATPVEEATKSNGSSTKNYEKIPSINHSFFKFGNGNPGSAATPSPELKPTPLTMPGTYPDDEEWVVDDEEFAESVREKPSPLKGEKSR